MFLVPEFENKTNLINLHSFYIIIVRSKKLRDVNVTFVIFKLDENAMLIILSVGVNNKLKIDF